MFGYYVYSKHAEMVKISTDVKKRPFGRFLNPRNITAIKKRDKLFLSLFSHYVMMLHFLKFIN